MYAKRFDSQSIEAFHHFMGEARIIVLASHMNADGDACGSVLGMARMLDHAVPAGTRIVPMLPNGCPNNFTWMPGSDRIMNGDTESERCAEVIAKADLIIGMDISSLSRTDHLQEALEQAKCRKVLIDHHRNPAIEQFDVVFSDYTISSTCELVLWLSQALWGGKYMDRETATCLYTGLRTDTGGFAFSCDQPSCFEAASVLVGYDIQPAEIHNRIVNTFTCNRMQFYGYALSQRLQIYKEKRVALFAFSLEDQKQFGVGGEDMEGLVNYTLMMKDIELGALLREEAGRTKVSLRAKYDIDVNQLAQQLGGGGHKKASGATCYMSFDDTLQAVCKLLNIENEQPYQCATA